MINTCTVAGVDEGADPAGAVEVVVVDSASRSQYGPASFTLSALPTVDRAQLELVGARVIGMRSQPSPAIDTVELSPIADPDAEPFVMAADVGDLITVAYTHPSLGWTWELPVHVHGVRHRIVPIGRDQLAGEWVCALTVADAAYWEAAETRGFTAGADQALMGRAAPTTCGGATYAADPRRDRRPADSVGRLRQRHPRPDDKISATKAELTVGWPAPPTAPLRVHDRRSQHAGLRLAGAWRPFPDRGKATGTTDANGRLIVNHLMGAIPSIVIVTAQSPAVWGPSDLGMPPTATMFVGRFFTGAGANYVGAITFGGEAWP